MSQNQSIFQEVLTDVKGVQDKYLGPDYPYYKYIKSPSEIGMSGKGNLNALGKDIDGIMAYTEILVSGKSKASATGQPLGNKFFLNTGAKCMDKATNTKVDRYIYIDNVPQGNIPIISSGAGQDFKDFRGLIPGTISNLNAFNPFKIMQGFLEGSTPDCQEITMETIDVKNKKSTETNYVTVIDIQNMDPCTFSNNKNPVTKVKCKETYDNMNSNSNNEYIYVMPKIPNDILAQFYIGTLGLLGIYILFRIIEKK